MCVYTCRRFRVIRSLQWSTCDMKSGGATYQSPGRGCSCNAQCPRRCPICTYKYRFYIVTLLQLMSALFCLCACSDLGEIGGGNQREIPHSFIVHYTRTWFLVNHFRRVYWILWRSHAVHPLALNQKCKVQWMCVTWHVLSGPALRARQLECALWIFYV